MRCNRDITFDWIELETYSAITPAQARPNHASLKQLGRDRTSGCSLIFSSPSCSGPHPQVLSPSSAPSPCRSLLQWKPRRPLRDFYQPELFLGFFTTRGWVFQTAHLPPTFCWQTFEDSSQILDWFCKIPEKYSISKYVNGKSCLLQIVPPQLPTPQNTLIRFDFQRFFGIWPGFPTIPANIYDLFTEKWWFQISPFFIGSIPTPWLVTWMYMSSLPTIAVLTRSSHARGTSIPLTSLYVGALRGTSPLLCGSLFSSLYSPKTSQHKCYPFTPNMFID